MKTATPSPRIRFLAGAILLAAGGLVAAASAGNSLDREKARSMVREHPLLALDGTTLTAGELAGEVLVINFWATWCKPCKHEMPLLDDLHRRMAGRGRVLAVSIDREPGRVARFVEEYRLGLPVFVDGPAGLIRKLDLPYLPYTIVIDASGRIAYAGNAAEGEAWTGLTEVVDRLLAAAESRGLKEKKS